MSKKKPPKKRQLNRLQLFKNFAYPKLLSFLKWAGVQRDIYPVLVFAVMPTLIFWTKANIQELTLSLLSRWLIVVLIIGLIIYMIFYLLLSVRKNSEFKIKSKSDKKLAIEKIEQKAVARYKASVLAIMTILVTFTYGQIYGYYSDAVKAVFDKKSPALEHGYFMALLLAAFIFIVIIVVRKLRLSPTVRNYLAILATILLAYNMYPIIRHWIENYDLSKLEFGETVQATLGIDNTDSPDIYYLVFDRYASESVLKNTYGFDNSPFLNSLREKGFYVASDSVANYPATSFSLSSSLNLDYLPEGFQNGSKNGLFASLLHDKMENNRVVPFLKSQGYSFINIGPWWNPTKYNQNADLDLISPAGVVLLDKKIDLKEHEQVLFEDTVLWPFFLKRPLKFGGDTIYGLTYPTDDTSGRSIQRQNNIHQFSALKQVSRRSGKKYVFAHFLFPHEPYVFDENCKRYRSKDEYEIYIKQLRCANTNIQETVEYILSHSKKDPIIIIQADEGPYPLEFRANKDLDWTKAPEKVLFQKTRILNAYYFPDSNYSKLRQDISPVNTFRIIFNQYLGTELPILEDRHYISESNTKRFHLLDITEKFKN